MVNRLTCFKKDERAGHNRHVFFFQRTTFKSGVGGITLRRTIP